MGLCVGSLSSKPRRKLGCLREFRRHRWRRVGPGARTRVGLRGRWRGATWSQREGSLGSRRVGEREWVRVVWRRVWGRSGLAGIGMGYSLFAILYFGLSHWTWYSTMECGEGSPFWPIRLKFEYITVSFYIFFLKEVYRLFYSIYGCKL